MKECLSIVFQAIGHFEVRLHSFRQRERSVQDLFGSTRTIKHSKKGFRGGAMNSHE